MLFLCVSFQGIDPFVMEYSESNVKIIRPLNKKEMMDYLISRNKRRILANRIITIAVLATIILSFLYFYQSFSMDVLAERIIMSQDPLLTGTLSLLINSIQVNDQRIAYYEVDGQAHFTFKKDTTLVLDQENADDRKLMVVLLHKMRVPPIKRQRTKLPNRLIGQLTGYTPAWVSQLVERYDKYGLQGLDRLPHGGLLTKKAEKQLAHYLSHDLNLTDKKLKKMLINDGFEDVTLDAVKNSIVNQNLLKLLPAFRAQKKGKMNQGEPRFLIESLVSFIDTLLPMIKDSQCDTVPLEDIIEKCSKYLKKEVETSYRSDVFNERIRKERVRTDKQNRLIGCLDGQGEITQCCICGSINFQKRGTRTRNNCQNIEGERVQRTAQRCYCKQCETYFTVSPKENEAYVQSDRELLTYALDDLFLGKSLRGVESSKINRKATANASSILRWINFVADTMPQWYEVYTPRTSGTIAIDEKWVKIRKKWYYVFMAVETESLDLLHINIYPSRCKNSAKAFLGELKAIGFSFDVIITDGCDAYLEPIKKVFPRAEHIHCVLHMGRSKKNALMEVFGSYRHKTYKKLAPYIRRIYKSRNEETFEKHWEEFIKEASKHPKLDHYIATMVDQKDYIRKRVIDEGNPRTTNSVERTIKEFQKKYIKME